MIEDCAQAAGARRNGRRAGSFGDVAAFSFYPTKNLGALGDGGAVATTNDEIAERVRRLRQYGWDREVRDHAAGGRNSRLDELQAAVLRSRLGQLDEWNARAGDASSRATRRRSRPRPAGSSPGRARTSSHISLCSSPTTGTASRAAAGALPAIGTDIHYPLPDHRQPAWRDDYADVASPSPSTRSTTC